MTKTELEKIVPIIDKEGTTIVRLIDIPNPYRSEFAADSLGSTMPFYDDEGFCYFSWDWEKWLKIRFRKNYKPRYTEEEYYVLLDHMVTKDGLFEMLNKPIEYKTTNTMRIEKTDIFCKVTFNDKEYIKQYGDSALFNPYEFAPEAIEVINKIEEIFNTLKELLPNG